MVLKMIKQSDDFCEQMSEIEESENDEDETLTKKRRWDCETILSQVSTHKNHPMEIKEDRIRTEKKFKKKLMDLVEDEVINFD